MNNSAVITVQDLGKVVHERTILSGISFTIERQSLVSLIGPNGAGKSTLINILLGFDTHYTGAVSRDPDARISYIPQIEANDPNAIPVSVREYINVGTSPLYTGKPRDKSHLGTMLEHVGVSSTKLDQSFWSLSGGERQRIAIARAILSDPDILVLDEPLSAVDYASRHDLYELIRHLQQDHHMTVILVSHDIDSVLPISDRILCINGTLHTDCHPCEYTPGVDKSPHHVHHHC